MKIKINNIESYRSPESITINVDDRIEKVPLINGNVVQDYGHIASGDSFTVSALFSKANFNAIISLWEARQKVSFTDDSGEIWANCRIVIRSYRYEETFKNYVLVNFEIWRC
jgi:hypothetical protein